MLQKIFNIQAKTITWAFGIIAVSSLISRFLGLIRDRILASNFGAGSDLDVYFAAFRIPDFVYNIMIAGGITVAFVPLFSEYFLKDKKEAWEFVNNVLNVFLFFVVLLSFVMAIFAPVLVRLVAPGFGTDQFSLAVLLTRILFLSPILLGLSSILSGILQYFNKFFAYALAPIFYNLGIIAGIILFSPKFGILGVVFGVILGAALHFCIQIPSAVMSGFRYKPIFNLKDLKLKRVFSLMLPRTLGVAAPQINLIVVTIIASFLPAGALSVFIFANNIQQIPLGLLGIPFAVAAFPALSQAWAAGKKEEFLLKFYGTFRKIIFSAITASAFIFIFKDQIIQLILQTGMFSEESAALASASLGLFALGIFASCLIPLVFRAFFSLQDTKTPTLTALISMVLNIFLSVGFVWALGFSNFFRNFIIKLFGLEETSNISVVGLALAFSADAILHLILLMLFFAKKMKNQQIKTQEVKLNG